MKMLILGIDGLGHDNLSSFGLTRLKARLDAGLCGNPQVDNNLSRGWCEIYSGQDCFGSGGFYQVPKKTGGRVTATQKTGLGRVISHVGADQMLWSRINALGLSMGIFTVPTITSPQQIDGFCVAGTGGGSFGGALSAKSLHPANLLEHRRIMGADLGFRMGYGSYLPKSVENLELVANKHLSDYFTTLRTALDRKPVDVAFVGTRFINELSYKFAKLVKQDPADKDAAALKQLVLALADAFDVMIDAFIAAADPDHVFVVSDHGIKSFDYRFNMNEALVDLGLVARDDLRFRAKTIIKPLQKVRVKGPTNPVIGMTYKLQDSTAFSCGYTNAVYLNDDRFFGKALEPAERTRLATDIAARLQDRCRTEPGMQDVTFGAIERGAYTDAPAADRLPMPDIRCSLPDGVVNLKQTQGISEAVTNDFGLGLYKTGVPGEYSGCKSSDTLAGYVGAHGDAVTLNRLTDLYGSILSVAGRIA